MEVKFTLADEKVNVIREVAALIGKKPEELIVDSFDLFVAQLTPIMHMARVYNSSAAILPSFFEAVQRSQNPPINMGAMTEILLNKLFTDDSIVQNLSKVRDFFHDKAQNAEQTEESSPPEDPKPTPKGPIPKGPIDIDEIIKRAKDNGTNA